MARYKLSEEDKKRDISVSMDIKLNEKLEKYMINKGITNKSKYIESLVKKDLKDRGVDINIDF